MDTELIDSQDVIDRPTAILEFIRAYLADHAYPPSIREIGDAVGLTSTSSVHYQLRSLERAGAIVRPGRKTPRAIALVGRRPGREPEPAGAAA